MLTQVSMYNCLLQVSGKFILGRPSPVAWKRFCAIIVHTGIHTLIFADGVSLEYGKFFGTTVVGCAKHGSLLKGMVAGIRRRIFASATPTFVGGKIMEQSLSATPWWVWWRIKGGARIHTWIFANGVSS